MSPSDTCCTVLMMRVALLLKFSRNDLCNKSLNWTRIFALRTCVSPPYRFIAFEPDDLATMFMSCCRAKDASLLILAGASSGSSPGSCELEMQSKICSAVLITGKKEKDARKTNRLVRPLPTFGSRSSPSYVPHTLRSFHYVCIHVTAYFGHFTKIHLFPFRDKQKIVE